MCTGGCYSWYEFCIRRSITEREAFIVVIVIIHNDVDGVVISFLEVPFELDVACIAQNISSRGVVPSVTVR